MNCVKCGKDTTENNVFCPDCLAQMADYPVKPGTPVLIPDHNPARRTSVRKFRAPEPEDVIRRQKKLIGLLAVSAAVLFIAWVLTTAMAVRMLIEEEHAPIGQNFGITTNHNEG